MDQRFFEKLCNGNFDEFQARARSPLSHLPHKRTFDASFSSFMKEEKASGTADTNTAARFAHSLEPEGNRIFYDPYAKYFISRGYKFVLGNPLLKYITTRYSERISPSCIMFVLIRTGYIDDYLKECIDDGIEQLVILGAGYDSRAYRFEELKNKVKVFEVDHPATQAVKIEKVKNIFGPLPDHVVYVGVDFTKEKLDEKLIESGYDGELRTLFIWEGVTYYLSAEDIDKTLSFVASNECEGSSIVFDYAYSSLLDKTCKDAIRILNYFEKVGEPYMFGIEGGKVESFLSTRGFYQIRDVKAKDLEETYFKRRRRRWGFLKISLFLDMSMQRLNLKMRPNGGVLGGGQ